MKHFDIIPVTNDFIEGANLTTSNGFFFLVKPENPSEFWEQKANENKYLANFIRGNKRATPLNKLQ